MNRTKANGLPTTRTTVRATDKKETVGVQQCTIAPIKAAAVRVDQRVAVRQTNRNAEGPFETGLLR